MRHTFTWNIYELLRTKFFSDVYGCILGSVLYLIYTSDIPITVIKFTLLYLQPQIAWRLYTCNFCLRRRNLFPIINRVTHRSLFNVVPINSPVGRLLLYTSILKPIWYYRVQLWDTASLTNWEKSKSEIDIFLKWSLPHHKDLNVAFVNMENIRHTVTY